MPDRPDFPRLLRTTRAAMRHNDAMRTRRRPGERPGRWRIGVDLGGTWVRVVARDARGRRRAVRHPSPGLAGLRGFLLDLRRRWGLERDGVESLVVASRGVWTDLERRRHRRRLRGLARHVTVMSDAEAAHLGALGGGGGILLLAGTGSMALGRDARGRWARAGGWGPLLGDEGSAFWIGREWLRATMDGAGFAQARRILASSDPVARIAGLAPGVLRRAREGSRPARLIVAQCQEGLADLLVRTARQLRLGSSVPVSWSGALLADPRFRAGVWRAARRAGLDVRPAYPRASAVAAAGQIAERLGASAALTRIAGTRVRSPARPSRRRVR
jgi:glucosamine kinase